VTQINSHIFSLSVVIYFKSFLKGFKLSMIIKACGLVVDKYFF